jgi:predicted Fe-Mo cluster-binding NifX family protein
MKIAIPLDKDLMFYNDNPYTAPKFAIYFIEGNKTDISFKMLMILDNPRYMEVSDKVEEIQKKCDCDKERQVDMQHICEHYSILETINSCSYLLAIKYCHNTYKTLQRGGIKIFKIPSIIKKTETAIKNFLVGASFANRIQSIHNAS